MRDRLIVGGGGAFIHFTGIYPLEYISHILSLILCF